MAKRKSKKDQLLPKMLTEPLLEALNLLANGQEEASFLLLQDQMVFFHQYLVDQGYKLTAKPPVLVNDKDTPQYVMDTVNLSAAEARLQEAHDTLKVYREHLVKQRQIEFDEMGGCKECQGRGWVVVWDTLDSMTGCYHESRGCENADCNALVTGPNKATGSKYDKFHNVHINLTDSPEEHQIILRLTKEVEDAKHAKDIHEGLIDDVRKGDFVEVKKGRKVPVGTVGVVFWLGDGDYGPRCGLKDENDVTHWSATKNLRVIRREGEIDQTD